MSIEKLSAVGAETCGRFEWRPIAIAPRDGQSVFIWYAGECVRAAYLSEHHGRIPQWYLLDQWRNWGPAASPPKYWMPLPDPPKEFSK